MDYIKKIISIIAVVMLFTSCSQYNKVLNSGTPVEQFKMATKLYEAQKFSKALVLFEKIIPFYRSKPQMERIQYMVANANFNTEDYVMAGYYFDKFSKNYPKSSKVEEACFLSALSYYKEAPRFSLESKDTKKALVAFQSFIDTYPNSSKISEANTYFDELRIRLERKSFEIAKGYYKTAAYDSRNYKAAITAFDNLLSDHLGTKFKEEALYYRFKAAHDYAIKSTNRRKPERIKFAVKAFDKFKRCFSESKYLNEANSMLVRLNKEQDNLINTQKS